MRNLKRALSLALASVMLLGMMVVGTSAAFTDADDIQNKEAAEVTAALGIISGYGDGSFGAENPVNRAEMATLIVKMLKGADFNANSYKAITLFNDIPAEMDWAKGYINYAAQAGVLAGYGDGSFKPEKTVSTAEAVTFIINALKVDAGEGQWPNTVMTKAVEMKLFGDLSLETNAPLTRDDLAVLLVEGLLYSATGKKEYAVDVIDTTIASAGIIAEIEEQVFTSQIAAKQYVNTLIEGDILPDTIVEDTEYEIKQVPASNLLNAQFGLVRDDVTAGTDDFGRPAVNYTASEVEDFGKMVYSVAAPTFTYVYGAEAADIKADLKNYKYATKAADTNQFAANIVGLVTADGTGVTVELSDSNKKTLPAIIAEYAKNNAIVEIFTDSKKVITDVVVTNTYAVKLTTHTSSTAKTAADGVTKIAKNVPYFELGSGKLYPATGFAKDDIVVVTVANNKLQSIAKTQKITGKMTSYTDDAVYTIEGGEYVVADAGLLSGFVANEKLTDDRLNTDYVYYIGVNGTIVNAEAVPGEEVTVDGYAYVLNANVVKVEDEGSWVAAGSTSYTAQVQVATTDGTVAIYDLGLKKAAADIMNADNTSALVNEGEWYVKVGANYVVVDVTSYNVTTTSAALKDALNDTLYAYSLKGDVIALAAVTAVGSQDAKGEVLGTTSDDIAKNTITVSINSKDVAVDATTKFVFIDTDSDITKNKATVLTGVASLTGDSYKVNNGKIVGVVAQASAKHDAATVTYVAKYVMILDETLPTAGTALDVVYVDGTYTVSKDGEDTVYNYIGIKADGSEIALTGAKDLAAGLYAYDTDNKLASSATALKSNDEKVTVVSDTVLKIGSTYYTYDKADLDVVIIASGATLKTGCEVLKVVDGTVVKALFITTKAS